ncbi:hypothetical protein [Halapricum desulfuricans]|uniref:Uncharacterized protein n=1 Tax=Halapricum desulfuricans TaxID=2841257 RepID=A0A897MW77_9EURY|nr:hypothetical protein [Halapricum desulfuricans]QSG06370.1 hypothetical protein HSR121_2038 [Halapricum desulfuricans]
MSQAAQIQTHKEQQKLAEKFEHDWPVTVVPRNPADYEPVPPETPWGWSHFIDMKKKRKIPGSVIRHTIEDGDVFEAEGDNRYRFLWTEPGTFRTFSLIVELRPEAFESDAAKHYAVTVYQMEH